MGKLLIRDIGEVDLVKKVAQLVQSQQGSDKKIITPIGDDAAVVAISSQFYTILTTDTLIENIHFSSTTMNAFSLGYKALAVNISDIAAMAGIPKYGLVSVGVEPKTKIDFVEEIYRGILSCAEKYNIKIVGGDTVRSSALILNVALVGEVEPDFLRTRGEAQIDDKILITGKLGLSAAGLEILLKPELDQDRKFKDLIKAHQFPPCRLKEARLASQNGARAMEDISDGLSSEIWHICEESKVGARIYLEALPRDEAMVKVAKRQNKNPLDFILYGGEDYEIVFTAPADKASEIKAKIEVETNTPVTIIGEIVSSDEKISLIDEKKQTFQLTHFGYDHFKQ